MEKRQIVFLYTELAAYFLACVDRLSSEPSVQVHIIRWQVNAEAPFDFTFSNSIKIYNRSDYASNHQLLDLVRTISPSVIYSSGWIDKGYLNVCKHFKSKIPVIVGFDNQWTGSLKQRLAALLSPFKIHNHFSHCWVPGDLQYEYAKRLGFKDGKILSGFYSCDFELFYNQYLGNKEEKSKDFPKRFIYIGRYYDFKGITDLWQAFIELQVESPNEWELWCLGTGNLEPVKHPQVKHFGFVQPSELPEFIKKTGVFVLPSHFEPWGVVVHEFAAAGFPIICSDRVGARTAFVENNFNGYIYKSGNISELKQTLSQVMKMSKGQLLLMAERSTIKSKKINPDAWVKEIMSVL